MRIGILTGGGDAPGLNAVIRAVVVKANSYQDEVIGFKMGWAGLLTRESEPLNLEMVEDIHRQGGTILGASRTNPFKIEKGPEKAFENLKKLKIDALIVTGGEDTLGVANNLHEMGAKVVGIPKTIDNDVNATDYTFGFDTAINRVTESLDRLHTTARSHHRVMVVEIMGRHAGWMTLYGGMAGGAHLILIPEEPFEIEEICEFIKKRQQKGRVYTLMAVAEGAKPVREEDFITQTREKDAFGHVRLGGIAQVLAKEIEKRTGLESRHMVLGHLQRGGEPSAFDRILATRFGVKAVELVKEGKFGQMVSLRGTEIASVALKEGVGTLKTVDKELYKLAKLFFG
jgi:6-phosphofructokinase 1